MPVIVEDLSGTTFGYWKCVGEAPPFYDGIGGYKLCRAWFCICTLCGVEWRVRQSVLRSGLSQRCKPCGLAHKGTVDNLSRVERVECESCGAKHMLGKRCYTPRLDEQLTRCDGCGAPKFANKADGHVCDTRTAVDFGGRRMSPLAGL